MHAGVLIPDGRLLEYSMRHRRHWRGVADAQRGLVHRAQAALEEETRPDRISCSSSLADVMVEHCREMRGEPSCEVSWPSMAMR